MERILLFENQQAMDKVLAVGEKRLIKAKGKSICLVRLATGLRAFEDECPHMSASLSKGHLNFSNEISCPWHTYRFSILTGEESDHRCSPLRFMEIAQEGEETFLLL